MSERKDSPETLAALVADGGSIDWDEALRSASDDRERRIIRHLRLVEGVARVHRTAGSAPPTPPSSSGPKAEGAPLRAASWGHLELREKLGEGSFGEVYRAWDPRIEREVALKLLKIGASSRVVEEGRLLAKLRHPNVVTVYGAEAHEGRVGLWMEFIRGRSLEQLLRDQGPFGAREAALIGINLCRALAAVHRAGVLHRDVKGDNAMREEGGRILLTDFGAGIESSAGKEEKEKSVSGTPLYMASELLRGEPATERSEIYSLGVLLYRLVTASFPIEAKTWGALRDQHARREAKLLRDERPDLPEAFVRVVERATAWNAEERFGTAGEMEQALSLALGTSSPPAPVPTAAPSRRMALWLGAAGLLAASAAIVGFLALRSPEERSGLGPSGSEVVRTTTSPPADARESGPPETTQPARISTTPASVPYTVEAALYRVPTGSSRRQRLEPGARLALNDRLTLEFKATAPLHVYVIDEDEAGHSYALFPLPGLEPKNPLPPGTTHVLPGSREGKDLSWTVDSAGGREHLMVLASPTRLVEFEAELNALARPGQMAVSIPAAAQVHLRGIGGIAETPTAQGGKPAGHLFEMAERLASRSEVVTGVWMRRIELENPRPEGP